MSSTKRGGKRSVADNYPTPAWCVHRVLEAAMLPAGNWLELGVGQGDIVRASQTIRPEVKWTGIDLRATPFIRKQQSLPTPLGDFHVGDVLKPGGAWAELSQRRFDVTIANPPFRYATEFLDQALRVSDHVVFLLRLNFIGTEGRSDFMRTYAPDVYVLPNRPSFRSSKKRKNSTDSIEYAWFVWGPPELRKRSEGVVRVLPPTPKDQRKAPSLRLPARETRGE